MQAFLATAVFAFICGLVYADQHHAKSDVPSNSSVLASLKDVPESTRIEIAGRLNNLTEGIEEKWDIVHDFMDGDESVTEFFGVDANGCDRKARKDYEDRCDESYEKVNDEAQLIEDEREKTEAVCCALEDFEKCSLRAYDKSNCVTDKDAVRENLKAARLFLTVIANITCSEFRGQCASYSSAATGYAGYALVFASALIQLFTSFM